MRELRPPARADGLDEELAFAVADAPPSSRWWIPVAVAYLVHRYRVLGSR